MKYLNVIIAAILLLCLAPMPYGYYVLARFIAMIVFSVFAYQSWSKKQTQWTIVFGALALLFQPFAKIALGRTMWNIVDVAVAIMLLVLWYKEKYSEHETPNSKH